MVGQISDGAVYYGFVGNQRIGYTGANTTNFSVSVNNISSSGDIVGTQGNGSGAPWSGGFYSTPANYSTTNPTDIIDPSIANQNIAGVTDQGIIVGTATPNAGQGYTYIFQYNPISNKTTKIALPFVAAAAGGAHLYACSTLPSPLQLNATAVSSDGNWIAGDYNNANDGSFGNFTYNLTTKVYAEFNTNMNGNTIMQNNITGINKHGIVVGWQSYNQTDNFNSYESSGFIYDAVNKVFINAKVQEPQATVGNIASTLLNGINDNGVIVGQSSGPNQLCDPNPIYGICGGPSYFFTTTYQ